MANIYASYPGGGGSGGGAVVASGLVNLPQGFNTVTVTYDVTLNIAVPPVFTFVNTTDANPIFLIGYVSAFSTSGFTAIYNAATDTANYQLQYVTSDAI